MTREQIIARRKELEKQRRDLHKMQKLLNVEFESLYVECGHANMQTYREMDGGFGSRCPDCGYTD